jgi:polyisoprenoid-binding protein YceI
MRKQLLVMTAAAFLIAPIALRAETYQIDGSHSVAGFSIRHMMVSNVSGAFSKVSGTVEFDPANPTLSKIDVTIDAGSINTRNEKRDADLRSANFFDVANFPTITFKSTKVEKVGEGRHRVIGDLMMHGVTNSVVLDVDGPKPEFQAQGAFRIGASATGKIDRKDFGITFNRTYDNGGVMLGDEVKLNIDVEMVRRPQQPPRPTS